MPFPHFWEYFMEKSIVDFKYGQLDKKNATYSAYNPQNVGAYFPIKSFQIYRVDF